MKKLHNLNKVAEWCKRKKVIARMVQGIYQRGSLYSKEATNPSVFTCTCLALILSSLDGCELHISMPGVEDDYVAAEIAMETNAFGVISDDSDFLCFQVIAIFISRSHTGTFRPSSSRHYRWPSLFITVWPFRWVT